MKYMTKHSRFRACFYALDIGLGFATDALWRCS